MMDNQSVNGKKTLQELIDNPNRTYRVDHQEHRPVSARRLVYPFHLPEDWGPEFEDRRDILYRPLFGASMENGHVIGYGNIVSPDNFIVDDATPNYETGSYHKTSLLTGDLRLPSPLYLDKRVCVLSAMFDKNYYHWLYHVVPRFKLVSGFDFDMIYVNDAQPFQRAYLQLFEVPPNMVISAADALHIQARELIFTSFLSILNDYAIEFLRELMPRSSLAATSHAKIYISRNQAPNKRNLTNEDEVYDFLHKEGFEKYELGALPVKEQIELFASASFIIGPHGAGMGNIVFCQPGTKIIEIFDPSYIHPCMWMQTSSLDLQYGYVLGQGVKDLDRPFIERLQQPITVHLEKFKSFYAEMNKSV